MIEIQRAAVKDFALNLCGKGCKHCAAGSPVARNSAGKWSHNEHGNCCNSHFIHQALDNWLDTHVGPVVPLPLAPALTPEQEAAEELLTDAALMKRDRDAFDAGFEAGKGLRDVENADRLQAAAEDMREALQSMTDFLRHAEWDSHSTEAHVGNLLEAARAALAKAGRP